MGTESFAIGITLTVIFMLEGLFPHYPGRVSRVRHAMPHVLTAFLNGLLRRFLLAWLTIGAIGWAQASLPISLPFGRPASGFELALVFVLFDIWMYFWHMANHRIWFL